MDRSARRSTPPRWGLAAVTAGVPIALLLALEGGLQLAGFGAVEPLFVPSERVPGHLEPNGRVAVRLVPNPYRPPLAKIDTVWFAARKPTGGLRVVVQGGSTAAGFPYGRFASPAGMLQQRLRAAFPAREIEVITTAMSAVNSWALLDFADEILAVEPDAVVVYAGHNEYLGLLGVGSTFSAGRSRAVTLAFLKLRELRIFRLLQWAWAGAGDLVARAGPEDDAATLMERVAAETEIPHGSALYRRGVEQLRDNLGSLLARYRAHGVPVLLGTLASNERHRAPFASRLTPGVDADAWQRSYRRAREALARGETAAAASALERCLALDDGAADAHFLRGRLLELQGRLAEARQAYLAAKDRDQLRFRAPEAMNDVIRELAREHGAVLVDTQRALADASPGGIIGDELMLEHLHPNVEGYFLLAEAFYDALRAAVLIDWQGRRVPRSLARRRQPVTEIDRLAGEHRVAELMARWPFRPRGAADPAPSPPPRGRPEELAQRMARGEISWTEAMQQGLAHYRERGDREEAARIAVDLAETYPHAAGAKAEAGRLLLAIGRTEEAIGWLERALALAPGTEDYARALEVARRTALLRGPGPPH